MIPEEGVIVKSSAAFIQGIFGIAGEKKGVISMISSSPEEELHEDQIISEMKGKILIGGSFVSIQAYKKALQYAQSDEERAEARYKLSKLPRNSAEVRHRNRCGLTGRPRAYYRKFNLSRIAFRELALEGMIPGVTKSSW